MKDHRLIDERSLALHRRVAEKLRGNPALVGFAQENIHRWLATCAPGVRPALLEWQTVLAGPFDAVLALLTAADERAARLRQSSPFAGCLGAEERNAILMEYHRRESHAA